MGIGHLVAATIAAFINRINVFKFKYKKDDSKVSVQIKMN